MKRITYILLSLQIALLLYFLLGVFAFNTTMKNVIGPRLQQDIKPLVLGYAYKEHRWMEIVVISTFLLSVFSCILLMKQLNKSSGANG